MRCKRNTQQKTAGTLKGRDNILYNVGDFIYSQLLPFGKSAVDIPDRFDFLLVKSADFLPLGTFLNVLFQETKSAFSFAFAGGHWFFRWLSVGIHLSVVPLGKQGYQLLRYRNIRRQNDVTAIEKYRGVDIRIDL